MKKVIISLVAIMFFAIPQLALAQDPLALSEEVESADAKSLHSTAMGHWDNGIYYECAKNFARAAKYDPDHGESLFNAALCKDKMGDHGAATMFFKEARKRANGNGDILGAQILIDHIGEE